jgi:DNA-3-methyladenine glycosylase
MKLNIEFYSQNAIILAPQLLGKLLCRNLDGEIIKFRITETESYFGEEDTACHAYKGKTERTKIMYENGGLAYIYLCYGIHYMFNIVTGVKNFPEAVLIRGIEGFNGPGKLTKILKINKILHGENLADSNKIWLEDDGYKCNFKATKRIGIDYASEEDKNKLWRFVLKQNC